MFRVKKTFEVAVAHRLELPYKSKCQGWHGHNLLITIYCESEELDKNGMVIDFTHIKEKIHDKIDHTSLVNVHCPKCEHVVIWASEDLDIENPTAENLAYWICMEINKCYRVDVEESEGNVATYVFGGRL